MILCENWGDKLYLSRIRLNTQKRSTQLALASPSKFHGAVEACCNYSNERKLWRIDPLKGNRYLLLLSPEKPNLTSIKEQYGYPEDADEIKCYDALLDNITEGSIWQFRLTANPTHSLPPSGSGRGKVVAPTSEKYQMEWLTKKASQNGFSLLSDESCVISSGWKAFHKANTKKKVQIKETTYQGILRVDEVSLFREALTHGIGRGKAYGMGLLTVMRL